MSDSHGFPFLAEVTDGLNPVMLAHVRRNLDTFSIEVRIDYERWIQYCKEYEHWLDERIDNQSLPTFEKESQNEI